MTDNAIPPAEELEAEMAPDLDAEIEALEALRPDVVTELRTRIDQLSSNTEALLDLLSERGNTMAATVERVNILEAKLEAVRVNIEAALVMRAKGLRILEDHAPALVEPAAVDDDGLAPEAAPAAAADPWPTLDPNGQPL